MTGQCDRFAAVLRDIDAANAEDPRRVEVTGVKTPYEVLYSERMSDRLARMYPGASETLRIAARAQHIRRWEIPRERFAAGRAGYNDWRKACREHHADLVANILTRQGYGRSDVAHVAKLIKKEQLKKDAESQALENVVGVVFIEHYLEDFLAKNTHYTEERLVDIVGKILRKMSPKGHGAALALELKPEIRALLTNAMARDAAVLAKLAEVAVD